MQRKVYQWEERFQNGREQTEDHSGHPTTSRMVDNGEQVHALIQEGDITVINIADILDISCGSAYSIIHEDLGYHKICARWVPKKLSDEHKQVHVETHMKTL